jgi:AbiV family abortive infection protein
MSATKLDQYKGRLGPVQIAEGINATFNNARRLAEDARLLFNNRRFPRAASLAILSIEESGKVSILRHLSVAESDQEVKDCWRDYRSHLKKNVMGALFDEMARGARKLDDFSDMFREDTDFPHLLDQVKQIGFYTDCLGRAHWSEPTTAVDEALAKQMVAAAELLVKSKEVSPKEIELWVKHLGPVWNKDPGWMRKALENWYEDMQRHGLAPDGPNTMRTFIREGIGAKEPKSQG